MGIIKNYITTSLLNIFFLIFNKNNVKDTIRLTSKSKVLLLQFGSITDALLSTPFIKVFEENTKSELHLICNKENSDVFQNNKSIIKIIELEDGLKNILKTVWLLRKKNYEVIIDLNENFIKNSSYLIGLLNEIRLHGKR